MDKRKFPRVPVEVNLQLWKDNKAKKKTKGLIKDITLEGMCIETDLSFASGADLIFSLDLPDKFKFNISGEIVWKKKNGKIFRYGVKFVKLHIAEKPKLYNFILATLSE